MEKVLSSSSRVSIDLLEDKKLVESIYFQLKKAIENKAKEDNIEFERVPFVFRNSVIDSVMIGYKELVCSLYI